jgi:hypothetical protein
LRRRTGSVRGAGIVSASDVRGWRRSADHGNLSPACSAVLARTVGGDLGGDRLIVLVRGAVRRFTAGGCSARPNVENRQHLAAVEVGQGDDGRDPGITIAGQPVGILGSVKQLTGTDLPIATGLRQALAKASERSGYTMVRPTSVGVGEGLGVARLSKRLEPRCRAKGGGRSHHRRSSCQFRICQPASWHQRLSHRLMRRHPLVCRVEYDALVYQLAAVIPSNGDRIIHTQVMNEGAVLIWPRLQWVPTIYQVKVAPILSLMLELKPRCAVQVEAITPRWQAGSWSRTRATVWHQS